MATPATQKKLPRRASAQSVGASEGSAGGDASAAFVNPYQHYTSQTPFEKEFLESYAPQKLLEEYQSYCEDNGIKPLHVLKTLTGALRYIAPPTPTVPQINPGNAVPLNPSAAAANRTRSAGGAKTVAAKGAAATTPAAAAAQAAANAQPSLQDALQKLPASGGGAVIERRYFYGAHAKLECTVPSPLLWQISAPSTNSAAPAAPPPTAAAPSAKTAKDNKVDANAAAASAAPVLTTDDLEWTLTTKQNVMAADDLKGILEAMRETPTLRAFKAFNVRIGGPPTSLLDLPQTLTTLHLDGLDDALRHFNLNLLVEPYTLTDLSLRFNHLNDTKMMTFAEGLKKNRSLHTLTLYNNLITDDGAMALAEALKTNTQLVALDLGRNRITDRGASAFAQALSKFLPSKIDEDNLRRRLEAEAAANEAASLGKYGNRRNSGDSSSMKKAAPSKGQSKTATPAAAPTAAKKGSTEASPKKEGAPAKPPSRGGPTSSKTGATKTSSDTVSDADKASDSHSNLPATIQMNGRVYLVGNRSLRSLNLSFNQLGSASLTQFLACLEDQEAYLRPVVATAAAMPTGMGPTVAPAESAPTHPTAGRPPSGRSSKESATGSSHASNAAINASGSGNAGNNGASVDPSNAFCVGVPQGLWRLELQGNAFDRSRALPPSLVFDEKEYAQAIALRESSATDHATWQAIRTVLATRCPYKEPAKRYSISSDLNGSYARNGTNPLTQMTSSFKLEAGKTGSVSSLQSDDVSASGKPKKKK